MSSLLPTGLLRSQFKVTLPGPLTARQLPPEVWARARVTQSLAVFPAALSPLTLAADLSHQAGSRADRNARECLGLPGPEVHAQVPRCAGSRALCLSRPVKHRKPERPRQEPAPTCAPHTMHTAPACKGVPVHGMSTSVKMGIVNGLC